MHSSRLLAALAGGAIATGGVVGCAAADPERLLDGTSAAESPAAVPDEPPVPRQATPEPKQHPPDNRLLPNLQSLPPEDVHIEVVDDDVRRLRFTSIIANTGVGPVETVPDDEQQCPPDQRHASQVIYLDTDGDGRFDRDVDVRTIVRPAGCMVHHADHEHWHFDAAARYVLTAPGNDEPIVSADKVSFCWRDSRETPAEAVSRPEEHYGDCEEDNAHGISPGWADVYLEDLADQHLDLPTDLPDGLYCLWNEADPLGLLVETTDADNWAVAAIEITGTEVARAPASTCDPVALP